MTTRTTQTIVRFSSAFLLPGFDAPQPAGEYRVDQDEESDGEEAGRARELARVTSHAHRDSGRARVTSWRDPRSR